MTISSAGVPAIAFSSCALSASCFLAVYEGQIWTSSSEIPVSTFGFPEQSPCRDFVVQYFC
jgi:hypothetical protein